MPSTRPALLREPALHFFALGALLFVVHRLVAGDPRTIAVSPELRDDLARVFRDQSGRSPSASEIESAVRSWKADEALYREALREGLDRDDLVLRSMLADKVRARAALEASAHEPSDSALDQWLATHRSLYETPLHYECDYLTFAKGEEKDRSRLLGVLTHGAAPSSLGHPVYQPNLTHEQLAEKLGEEAAERIGKLPPDEWHALDTPTELLLLRVNRVLGGLPSRDKLRDRLVFDWQTEMRRMAVDRAVEQIVARYRFVERAP
jgi:hypothetical protein